VKIVLRIRPTSWFIAIASLLFGIAWGLLIGASQ